MSPRATGVAPRPDEHSRAYWDAAREGCLLIQRCTGCRRYQFYPRPFCASCLAPAPEWIVAGGGGRLHTFSVVHHTTDGRFRGEPPYVLGIIELDEGVHLTTRVVGCEPDRLRCEMRVRVVFEQGADDFVLPCFEPVEGRS